jgi:hypothetical protein
MGKNQDLDPGSGILIRDEHPGSYFRKLRNNFLVENTYNSSMWMRIRNLLNPGSGILDGKIRIRDKHAGSATPVTKDSVSGRF